YDGWYQLMNGYSPVRTAFGSTGYTTAAAVNAASPTKVSASTSTGTNAWLYGYNMSLDEFRIVQNGTVLIPEPSSAFLIGLSGLGLLVRRRK
ncbi:MAG: PEP-CTERM sorting domain-containing protein, partial [Chthoniobacterales bacterium]